MNKICASLAGLLLAVSFGSVAFAQSNPAEAAALEVCQDQADEKNLDEESFDEYVALGLAKASEIKKYSLTSPPIRE